MNHVLLIYKKSKYELYFRDHPRQLERSHNVFTDEDMARLQAAHDSHARSLDTVRNELSRRGIRFRSVYRARRIDFSPYDFVIAVGGDGTFIEASRKITDQTILGVNSDPTHSWGYFCGVDAAGFPEMLDRLLDNKARVRRVNRMALKLNDKPLDFYTVNEVLVAHRWPAGMSTYRLRIGGEEEAQRGSGVWICTAAGSTGAVLSAGGKAQPLGSKRLQYLPRELFVNDKAKYRLRGGIVVPEPPIEVRSMMREGLIFVDGCHLRYPFPFGARLELSNAPHPLRTIVE